MTILSAGGIDTLGVTLDEIGLGSAVEEGGSALIKINLAHLPEPGHPRTDPSLLAAVVGYVSRLGARCAIAEGANGSLMQNLGRVGLADVVEYHNVKVIDLDLEDADRAVVGYFSGWIGSWLDRKPALASRLRWVTGSVLVGLGVRLAFTKRGE